METGSADRLRAVLGALADLSPSAAARDSSWSVPTAWFRWLPAYTVRLFPRASGLVSTAVLGGPVPVERGLAERLAAVDQIRPEERPLRVGWLWVAGRTVDADGQSHRVLRPLVTVPVRVMHSSGFVSAMLAPAGDAELTELVADRFTAHRLDRSLEFGGGALDTLSEERIPASLIERLPRLRHFAIEVAAAAGLPSEEVVPVDEGPEQLLRLDGLRIVVGAAVYVTYEVGGTSRAGSLRAWAQGPFRGPNAFESIYVDPSSLDDAPANADDDRAVESPFVLTPAQKNAVRRSRREVVSVVSGAPGTGKSHTVTAIACDALARGETVLVAAKSDATVDALLDLLERAPGPDPVVFGSNERRDALAERLAAGQHDVAGDDRVERAHRAFEDAVAARDRLRGLMERMLESEATLHRGDEEVWALRVIAPALFEPGTDLDAVGRHLKAAARPGGLLAAVRSRRQERRARLLAGVPAESMTIAELEAAIDLVRAARSGAALAASGGLEMGPLWDKLTTLDREVSTALAELLAVESRSGHRLNRHTLPAIAALATGLRSGRAARREQLARLDDRELTLALPLWVGSLPDIDDLLPPTAGLFDLVILDEASSIDQSSAAPALLRARRAVVVGDPRQLRHVSFLSDGTLAQVLSAHQLGGDQLLAARLDVRRNSIFDVAAGVAAVQTLDEHFRSSPHLVSFVFDRLYGHAISVATRSPQTDGEDCIEVLMLHGTRNAEGVVEDEVARVVRELKSLDRDGHRSVGVVSPFRAQAEAIEASVLSEFRADALERMDLRVGTVHAFQGNERDVIVASVGVGPDAAAATWRFVEEPHLFAVFATRARRRFIILLSADPPTGGLFADYLAQADAPPGAPDPAEQVAWWPQAVADDLADTGLEVRTAYPTGRHVVDVCVHAPGTSVAVECAVHRDGPAAHIERHLALVRSGWTVLEAHRSRWEGRRGELAVELSRRIAKL